MRRAGLVALVVLLAAPQARADSTSPLTELVDAAAAAVADGRTGGGLQMADARRHRGPRPRRARTRRIARRRHRASASTRIMSPGSSGTRSTPPRPSNTAASRIGSSTRPTRRPRAPDLSASRSTIDGLNQTMLTQIALNWDLLHSPACAGALDAASSDVVGARRLDNLYQQALSSATRSYCS